MLLKYPIIIVLLVCSSLQSQIIDIPDTNFKFKLLNIGSVDVDGDGIYESNADTNSDGEIQVSEAEDVIRLSLKNNFSAPNSEKIISLEGLQYFINIEILLLKNNLVSSIDVAQMQNLQILKCGFNQLTALDVSQNSGLTHLKCSNNLLTTMDVTQNPSLELLDFYHNQLSQIDTSENVVLEELDCSDNQMISLDLSNNPAIDHLHASNNLLSSLDLSQNSTLGRMACNNNQITSLDLSQNLGLYWLECHGNPLTDLDLSQNQILRVLMCQNTQLYSLNIKNGYNIGLWWMWADNNPNLDCIQVDDETMIPDPCFTEPPNGGWCKDPNTIYSEECVLSVNNTDSPLEISLYPNPVKNNLYLESQLDIQSIKVYDILGRLVMEKDKNLKEIDLSDIATGVLILQIETTEGTFRKKLVKE